MDEPDIPEDTLGRPGHDDLWEWFGLSYATWLTLPRILMHEMPDSWQQKMANLLHEYNEEFPNQPYLGTRVQCTTPSGKLAQTPNWVTEYRHPLNVMLDIDELRKQP